MSQIKKKMLTRQAEVIGAYDFDTSLARLSELVAGLIEQYGPDARLDYGQHTSYSDSYSYAVLVQEEESDEEFAKRVEELAAHQKLNDDKERALYVKLREKFGDE